MSGYYHHYDDDDVRRYYQEQERLARMSERRAKKSFFARLRQAGLSWVVGRLVDLGWHAIRIAIFGF